MLPKVKRLATFRRIIGRGVNFSRDAEWGILDGRSNQLKTRMRYWGRDPVRIWSEFPVLVSGFGTVPKPQMIKGDHLELLPLNKVDVEGETL